MLSYITEKLGIEGRLFEPEMDKLFELSIGKNCLEVGSWKGLSSFCIALGAKKLYCVDTFKADGDHMSDFFTTLADFQRNTVRFGNINTIPEWSKDAERILANHKFEFIFIDAGHEYIDIRNDYELWWKHLVIGGIMAFHDYTPNYDGVVRFINETFGIPHNIINSLVWEIKYHE